MRHRTAGTTPLKRFDLNSGQSLGIVEFPEFERFAHSIQDNENSHTTSGNTLWNRFAALSAYGAGLPSPRIGLVTPVLGPFMFKGQEVVRPDEDGTTAARLVVDGLYSYMAHDTYPVIRNFGASSIDATHQFLNSRIDALKS